MHNLFKTNLVLSNKLLRETMINCTIIFRAITWHHYYASIKTNIYNILLKMAYYTFGEYCDMHAMLGACHGSPQVAARAYAVRYPDRRHPDKNVIARLDDRLRNTGSMGVVRPDAGRPRSTRTVRFDEAVMNAVEEDPTRSTRSIGHQLGKHHSLVHRTLSEEGCHPFHYTQVQELKQEDFALRLEFCHWLLAEHRMNGNITRKILFTDESIFQREGVFNQHNSHHWAYENPYVKRVRSFQNRWGFNIWAGVIDRYLVGPYMLPDRLNGDGYAHFLTVVLPELLAVVPPEVTQGIYYQHDGAPPHFALRPRRWLDNNFAGRWIGRGGPIRWPPRSPDLNPLDYGIWGWMKTFVYKEQPASLEELEGKLHEATAIMSEECLGECVDNLIHRAEMCIYAGGAQFEHLL